MSSKTLESNPEFTRLMAHELTHHWFLREGKHAVSALAVKDSADMAIWIEEGIAYLVEYLVTNRLSGNPIIQFMNHAGASLTKSDPHGPMRQMGHAQLLLVYLYEKLGDDFLTALLSSKMNSFESISAAIPKGNDFNWSSFQDAFRDFQIAKFLNRQDNLAHTDADRERYFIFPTTIAARGSTTVISEWSGVEYKILEQMSTDPMNLEYDDFSVIDDLSQPVTLRRVKHNHRSRPNERFFRIFYQ